MTALMESYESPDRVVAASSMNYSINLRSFMQCFFFYLYTIVCVPLFCLCFAVPTAASFTCKQKAHEDPQKSQARPTKVFFFLPAKPK